MSTPVAESPEAKRRPVRLPQRKMRRFVEGVIESGLLLCGLLSIGITIAIAFVMIEGSVEFFGKKEVWIERRKGDVKEYILQSRGNKEIVLEEVEGEQIVIEERTPGQVDKAKRDHDRERTLRWMSGAETWSRISYFFTGTVWDNVNDRFGVVPLLIGTFWIAVISGCVAIPIGVVSAIYLSEYASPRVRSFAKPALELLAGVPSIVYGFFAVTVVTPLLASPFTLFGIDFQPIIPGLNTTNQISGGLVVGIMIIPLVASLSEDALRAVPRSLRDGAVALGATKFETSTKVVVPAALSGIVASFILALSRAIGETMAVSLACGENNTFTLDPRQGITTLTSFIVRRAKGEIEHGTTEYNCLFAVGLLLFLITLGMNVLAQRIRKRYRQVYQ
jgi:phosphate transport system permease protein